jgi:hypothetical protein
MISQLKTLVLGLTAIAGMGLSGLASAGDAVPFQGVAAAVLTGAETDDDGTHLSASATGQATHLGQFTRTENLVLYADGSFVGTLTFIAANGDELDADFVGQFTSPTTAVATYTFTGGTGRFADASGGADATVVTSDGIHFSIAFDGAIAY